MWVDYVNLLEELVGMGLMMEVRLPMSAEYGLGIRSGCIVIVPRPTRLVTSAGNVHKFYYVGRMMN